MKIVLVGGNSNLGQALTQTLGSHHDVITVGRSRCDICWDIRFDIDAAEFPHQIDVMINSAADFGGDGTSAYISSFETNVIGSLRVCDLAKKLAVPHVIHISSMSAALSEYSPYFSVYALTKKQGEEVASFSLKYSNTRLTILRPTQIFGNPGMHVHQPLLYSMIERASSGKDIVIFGSRSALRNYIFIDDLVEIINRAIQLQPTGIFFAGALQDVSYLTLANAILKATDSASKVCFDASKSDICDNIFDKDDNLYKAIKFYPNTPIEVSVRKTIERLHAEN